MTSGGLGRIEDGGVAVLDTPYPDAAALIEATGSLDALATAKVVRRFPLDGNGAGDGHGNGAGDGAGLLAPIARPRAVWGIGMNYRSKAELTGRPVPDQPVLYLAAPSSVCGPGAAVRLPAGQTAEMDYEAEIAVVIGRTLDHTAEDDAWSAVAAVTAANDMTCRDVMKRTSAPVLAKSFPGFTPLGASLLGRHEIAGPDAIGVRSWVRGESRQDSTSADMIFPIPELLARISRYAVLHPGDVVLTGTPAGTGQDRGDFLRPGDTVRVEIDGVLPLTIRVRA
ncbi:fumarylacetoacetate hydrolase family protein [Actinomadura sp. 3N407]|uniref:fumarylacetoacetate hydrolase family protein n=1 Tax=Actinomadura sp. 3N407 TaxID=3457423 RepID=UPI003FCC7832